jgi:hypothetical protein
MSIENAQALSGQSESGRCGDDIGKREWAEKFYRELLRKALEKIESLEGDVVMVCGPLRGKDGDDPHTNLARLSGRICDMSNRCTVFDQTAYLESELIDPPNQVEMKMKVFYQGILMSGLISKIYVLPGWETSRGTLQEIGYAERAGIEIEYLSMDRLL